MVKFQHGSTESGFQFLWFEQGYVPLETLVGCNVVFEAVSGDVKEDVSISYFLMTLGANWSKECLFYKNDKSCCYLRSDPGSCGEKGYCFV